MALITSTASGNFNAGATWTGGVVPVAGDEARAATGHTITINVNTTCDEVSNDGTGIFTLNDGITLTANVTNKTTTAARNCVQFTAVSPAAATIVGNITNGTASGTAVINTSTGALTITGNVTGSSGTFNQAVNNNSTGSVTITGNCTGGSGQDSRGVANSSTGSVTITGNVTGGSGTQGGSGGSSGAGNQSTGSMTITGNVTGGTGTTAPGAHNNTTGTTIINGSIYASETNYGVTGTNRGQVTRLTGPFYTTATFGVNPIGCLAWRWDTSLVNTTFIEVPTQDLASKRNLVTPDNATNFPSASNVRSGTTYGISGALTGTCAVPPAASVATGVPVDNTTGTASLTPADFWNALTSGMSTSGSIGVRLKNASTLDSTGQQLADALSP
jgi:hypothetical protein